MQSIERPIDRPIEHWQNLIFFPLHGKGLLHHTFWYGLVFNFQELSTSRFIVNEVVYSTQKEKDTSEASDKEGTGSATVIPAFIMFRCVYFNAFFWNKRRKPCGDCSWYQMQCLISWYKTIFKRTLLSLPCTPRENIPQGRLSSSLHGYPVENFSKGICKMPHKHP